MCQALRAAIRIREAALQLHGGNNSGRSPPVVKVHACRLSHLAACKCPSSSGSKLQSIEPSGLDRFHVCEQFCSEAQELQDCKSSEWAGDNAVEPAPCQPRQPTVHANADHCIDIRACRSHLCATIEALAHVGAGLVLLCACDLS